MIGGIAETQEMLDFCAAHGVGVEIELVARRDHGGRHERVLDSDVRYRFSSSSTAMI
ncbi:alcohol dehydrogenase (NADP(+)) OS=Streptomyces griseomycini OX=66895 GN=FHS37_001344 PE=3 SV=1 [Streptomyces griseomycini]